MFTGFTDATVDFMWGIRFNNERAWFEAHKEDYLQSFYRPMKELGAEVYDYISAKRPEDPLVDGDAVLRLNIDQGRKFNHRVIVQDVMDMEGVHYVEELG